MVVASLMQQGIELGVKKMIHHCQWDMERRVVVASMMQHGIELGIGKMMHHCQCGERNGIGSSEWLLQHGIQLGVGKMMHHCQVAYEGNEIWSGKWLLHH